VDNVYQNSKYVVKNGEKVIEESQLLIREIEGWKVRSETRK
jgi:hypothetical protein